MTRDFFNKPVNLEIVKKMTAEGYPFYKIAEFLGIARNTLYRHYRLDQDFADAVKQGEKEKADKRQWYWRNLRRLRARRCRPVTFWVTAGEEDVLNITLRELRQSVSAAEKDDEIRS